jgi:hypothetical protein
VVKADAGGGERCQDGRGDTGGVTVGGDRDGARVPRGGERGDEVVGDAMRVAAAAGHRALVDVPPHRRLRRRRRRPRRRRRALSHCLRGSDGLLIGWLA